MTTPNKNVQSNSALDSVQYPSQSADFLSLDAGKCFKMQQSSKGRDSPYHLQRNQRESYRKPFKNNQYGCREDQNQFYNRRRNVEYDFSLYFHPCMLQDPWENLLSRYKSLCSSKICLPQKKEYGDESLY